VVELYLLYGTVVLSHGVHSSSSVELFLVYHMKMTRVEVEGKQLLPSRIYNHFEYFNLIFASWHFLLSVSSSKIIILPFFLTK
jgi:hypothetical protein